MHTCASMSCSLCWEWKFELWITLNQTQSTASWEVLSVVSTQYKSVLDAIRANSKTFLFVDEVKLGMQHKKAILGVLVMYLYHFVLVHSPWGSKSKIRQDRDQLQFFVISLLAGDWQTVCVELRRRSYVWWRPVVPLSRCAVARSWWQHVTCLAFNGSDLKIFEEPWLCWQNGVTGKLEGTQPDLETEHVSLHD